MNKADTEKKPEEIGVDTLKNALECRLQLSEKQAQAAVHGFLECVITSIVQGHSVQLGGLGTLSVIVQPAREATRQGKRYITQEKKQVAFKVKRALREQLSPGAYVQKGDT